MIAALREAAAHAEAVRGDEGYHVFGLPALRAAFAARYETRGVPTEPEQIMVTVGAQQAIDLLARTYVRGREPVIVESPTYPGAIDSLRLAGARLISSDVSAEPWQLDEFETLIVQTGSRLAYLIPDFTTRPGVSWMRRDASASSFSAASTVTLFVDESLAEVAIDLDPGVRPLAAHDTTSA